jgi:hypothetical protein
LASDVGNANDDTGGPDMATFIQPTPGVGGEMVPGGRLRFQAWVEKPRLLEVPEERTLNHPVMLPVTLPKAQDPVAAYAACVTPGGPGIGPENPTAVGSAVTDSDQGSPTEIGTGVPEATKEKTPPNVYVIGSACAVLGPNRTADPKARARRRRIGTSRVARMEEGDRV